MKSLEELRKASGLSQSALAERLALKLGGPSGTPSVPYTVKRISQMENRILQPNRSDVQALADIFDKPVEEIERCFGEIDNESRGINSSSFFASLRSRFAAAGNASAHTLLAVAYGGKRGAGYAVNPNYDDDLLYAIEHLNTFVAMFVPYPSERWFSEGSGSQRVHAPGVDNVGYENHLALMHAYRDARLHAFSRFQTLGSRLPQSCEARIALYAPNLTKPAKSPATFPPFNYRQLLVVTKDAEEKVSKQLFAWTIPSEIVKEIADSQMMAWSAWFGEPVTHWIGSDPPALLDKPTEWPWKKVMALSDLEE